MFAKLLNETYVHYYGNILEQVTKVTDEGSLFKKNIPTAKQHTYKLQQPECILCLKLAITSFRHNMHPGCCNLYICCLAVEIFFFKQGTFIRKK